MLIDDIIKTVNRMLAGEVLTYDRAIVYLDEVVDEINGKLSSCFPTISEEVSRLEEEAGETVSISVIDYSYFPAKYIRGVLCKGAAYKFYTQDEEGIASANQFGWDYKDALFEMLRDFVAYVPEEYMNDTVASVVKDEYYRAGNIPFWFNQFGE